MVEFLLLDLDDTILDFRWAEDQAIRRTFVDFGIDPTDEVVALYRQINWDHWRRLETGELDREQVRVGRFAVLFEALGMSGDALSCADTYVKYLSQGHKFLPGAEETLKRLAEKYRLFLVTNGNPPVQYGRLASAGISHYFEKIFISYEIGHNKPSVEFFDTCFTQIPGFDKARAMIIGDSQGSDMQGGTNAGIATCWINPNHWERREGVRIDHEIESLAQVEEILESMQ